MVIVVIEHLEPVLTPWAYLEYRHAAELAGELLITNIKSESERRCIDEFAETHSQSIRDLAHSRDVLILDPQAETLLSPLDFQRYEYVVIGGIMGDFPPRGRTRKLLASRIGGAASRSLGPCQFSVDGAVFVALEVARGVELREVWVTSGLTLEREGIEVHLPFCYPLSGGRVVVSHELLTYVLTLLEEDEAYSIATGNVRSIADYGCRLELPPVEYVLKLGRVVNIASLLREGPEASDSCSTGS
ncbi:MAG: hypothetical protein DRK00_03205 [Thermoprotei archaeon]|nr:MAG: hypothetical protein DRK00_03205 [Thermoprotei archaeon]